MCLPATTIYDEKVDVAAQFAIWAQNAKDKELKLKKAKPEPDCEEKELEGRNQLPPRKEQEGLSLQPRSSNRKRK